MISFIVDGFDPWEKVYAILRRIYDADIDDSYEIIVMSSLLLDTPRGICESAGKNLFGNRFLFVNNDSLSIVDSRCRAQELAHGETFFYISPSVLPAKKAISNLLGSLDCHSKLIFAGSPLTFSYDNMGEERILAHGYAVAPTQKLTPFLLTLPKDAAVCMVDYPVYFVAPFCFCSHGPFYTHEDKGQNSFWRHMAACTRQCRGDTKGLSVGKAPARMYDEAFPPYFRSLCAETSLGDAMNSSDLERLARIAQGGLELTPYGDFRVKSPAACWFLPQKGDTGERIFWSLLYWERPEFIAGASHGHPTEALRELAQTCLWKIACTSWQYIRKHIAEQRNIVPHQDKELLQAYSDWFTTYEPLANIIYANDNISLFKSFINSKSFYISIKNYLYILLSGLIGLRK